MKNKWILNFCQGFEDYKIIYISLFFTLSILYFINPLTNVDLISWDRTFSTAVVNGISINKRVSNFYFLFLFQFPLILTVSYSITSNILKNFNKLRDMICNFDFIMTAPLIISYLFRYPSGSSEIRMNIFVIFLIIVHILAAIFILCMPNRVSDKNFDNVSVFDKFLPCLNDLIISKYDWAKVVISFTTTLIILYFLSGLFMLSLPKFAFIICILMHIILLPSLFVILYKIQISFLRLKTEYQKIFLNFNLLLIIPLFIGFYSRFILPHSHRYPLISYNPSIDSINYLIFLAAVFQICLLIISFIDDKQVKNMKIAIFDFLSFIVFNVIFTILLNTSVLINITITSTLYILCNFWMLKCNTKDITNKAVLNFIALVMGIPFMIGVLIEILYSLNSSIGIFVNNPFFVVKISIIIGIICSIIFSFSQRKRKYDLLNLGFYLGIISIASLLFFGHEYQTEFDYVGYYDIYEIANNTVAIDTMLNAKMPILEYFSAHALSDIWSRILFYFTNGSIWGTFTDPYANLTFFINYIILFFMIKKMFNIEIAALFAIMFPFVSQGLYMSIIPFVDIFALFYLLQNEKIKSYYIFWLIVLFTAFYKYDQGIFLGIASILTYLTVKLIKRESIFKFIISGISVGVVFLLFCIIYCSKFDIDVILRFKEWVSLTLNSSSSWATDVFGNPSKTSFFVPYFLAPLTAIIGLITGVIYYLKDNDKKFISVALILFSYIAILFIPRGIVYHNLYVCRGATGVLLNVFPWIVPLLVLVLIGKNKSIWQRFFIFAGSMISMIYFCAFTTYIYPCNKNILVNNAYWYAKQINANLISEKIKGKERVVLSEKTIDFVQQFNNIFKILLKDNETFLDFANITALYPLTQRERPFYVSQSPSLLTDLYTQRRYFEQISRYNIPLAILGTNDLPYIAQMITIPHNIRYYSIAEYIYLNYKPLIKTGDFAIWADKKHYEDYKRKLDKYPEYRDHMISYGYDFAINNEYSPLHYADLKLLPYIWANYDKYNAKDNAVIQSVISKNNIYTFQGSSKIDKSIGNYILFICSNNSGKAIDMQLKLYDNKVKDANYIYKFVVPEGENKFMIRISQDYYWYAFNIDSMQFTSEDDFTILDLKILNGDVIQD